MALGLLLILSASFLAVQFWSDGQLRRGAVQALEAPVMPKALEIGKKNGKAPGKNSVKAAPKIVKNDPEADNEVPEEKAVPIDQDEAELPKDVEGDLPDEKASVEEPKPVKASEKKALATAPTVEKSAEPSAGEPVEKKAAVEPVKEVKEVKAEEKKPDIKPEVKKPAKAGRSSKASRSAKAAKKALEIEEDSGVVPPEWDWFSTPLKIELNQGQVQIVPAVAPVDLKLVTVAARTADVEAPSFVEDVKKLDSESKKVVEASIAVSEKPFSKALERMAKIRKIREAREKKIAEKENKQITVVDEVSPSMKKLGETLRKLSEKLDKASVTKENVETSSETVSDAGKAATFEEAPPVKATGGSEDLESADINNQLKPFYSGSGSSFSNRVNELIQRGDWLRD